MKRSHADGVAHQLEFSETLSVPGLCRAVIFRCEVLVTMLVRDLRTHVLRWQQLQGGSGYANFFLLRPLKCPSRNEQRGRGEPRMLSSWDHRPLQRAVLPPLPRQDTAEYATEPIGLLPHLWRSCNHLWHVTGEALRAEKAPLPSRRRAVSRIPIS